MTTSRNNTGCEQDTRPQPDGEKARLPVTREDFARAFDDVRRKANAGDARARKVMRIYLDSHPEVWTRFGNLAGYAETALIEAASGGEWLVSEAIRKEAARMRQELAGPEPTPLERIAVERIVMTWLQLQHTQIRFAESQNDLGWAKYWLRRLEVADKLYHSATAALALIRNLLPTQSYANKRNLADSTSSETLDGDAANGTALPAETLEGSGAVVNRIAHLSTQWGYAQPPTTGNHAAGEPKVNGHRHRLEELLAPHAGD